MAASLAFFHARPRRRRRSGMVMMEVIVSLVILGMSVAAIMRSFQMSLTAIRKNEITTTASRLAEGLLQDQESDPPRGKKGTENGDFSEQGFPYYRWELAYDIEEIKYRRKAKSDRYEDLKDLNHVKVTITYDDGKLRQFTALVVETYLMTPLERFSQRSKQENDLFEDDQDSRRR